MFRSFTKTANDLGFLGFAKIWDSLFLSTINDITLLITSNNHMTFDVNTILCIVIVHLIYPLTARVVEAPKMIS